MTEQLIRNPNNQKHFMHIQPIGLNVVVRVGDVPIVSSENAVWLQETGNGIYAPRIYLPQTDLQVDLDPTDKTTHCPLKGDAFYLSYQGQEIAWGYELPFEFADHIAGMISFWPERVCIVLGG